MSSALFLGHAEMYEVSVPFITETDEVHDAHFRLLLNLGLLPVNEFSQINILTRQTDGQTDGRTDGDTCVYSYIYGPQVNPCWVNVGPPSATLDKHLTNIGLIYLVVGWQLFHSYSAGIDPRTVRVKLFIIVVES